MATTKTKECNQCNSTKPLTDFYKMSASKDGHQPKCKICVKEVNQNFRENKPEYQIEWQRTNHTKWAKYVSDWAKENAKADDSRSAIYTIQNEAGEIYVGSTQTLFSQRKSAHKIQYLNKTRRIPLLHNSFDKHGYDNHKWTILDMSGVDRDTLRAIEYQMINNFNNLGISLNTRLK